VIRRIAVGLLLLLSITILASVSGCGSNVPAGAVAQVGDKVVTEKELNDLLNAYVATGKAPDKGKQPDAFKLFKQKCAEYLVILQVLYQEGSEFSVAVTQADVDSGIDQIRRMFLGDDAKFNEAITKQGMTMAELRTAVEQNLWLTKMKEAVTANVAVKESEVQDYYQKHKSEYVLAESREVRHILISPFLDASGNPMTETPTQTDWDAAEAEAAKVRSDIMNGANFVTEVEKYSDDIASKSNGGDLGDIVRGQTAPAFEQAVFQLKKDELSQPVRPPSGYSIIQVMDITPAQQLAYDSVKEQIRSKLLTERETQTWNDWLTETIKKLGVVYRTGYAPPGAVTAGLPAGATTAATESESSTTTGSGTETTTRNGTTTTTGTGGATTTTVSE
jgi:peptidyl-prolyl cis-trans isomerase C